MERTRTVKQTCCYTWIKPAANFNCTGVNLEWNCTGILRLIKNEVQIELKPE